MPRRGTGSKVGRGGPRTGTPGQSYSNRTDLNGTQAPQAAPGQTYGERGQQEAAQQVVPLPERGQPGAGGPPTPAPAPGQLTPPGAPSARRGQPITSGIDSGPGPDSSVLASAPRNRGSRALDRIAAESQDPFLMAMANRARQSRTGRR